MGLANVGIRPPLRRPRVDRNRLPRLGQCAQYAAVDCEGGVELELARCELAHRAAVYSVDKSKAGTAKRLGEPEERETPFWPLTRPTEFEMQSWGGSMDGFGGRMGRGMSASRLIWIVASPGMVRRCTALPDQGATHCTYYSKRLGQKRHTCNLSTSYGMSEAESDIRVHSQGRGCP